LPGDPIASFGTLDRGGAAISQFSICDVTDAMSVEHADRLGLFKANRLSVLAKSSRNGI
jgi:hypothetical protein